MSVLDLVEGYVGAWNRHAALEIAAFFTEHGTYSDPASGRLAASSLGPYVAALTEAFPDLEFTPTWMSECRDGVVFQWRMTGTNTGSFFGAPPGGATVAFPGTSVLTIDQGRIVSVDAQFDQRTLADQLGLQVLVQPHRVGRLEFGRAVRVRSESDDDLGALSLTWIDVATTEDYDYVLDNSRMLALQLAETDGFLGWIGMSVGRRMYTLTAWRDADCARQLSAFPTHRKAAAAFFTKTLGEALHTGTWQPNHLNPVWWRCAHCRGLTRAQDADGACRCGTAWPTAVPAL